MKTIEKGHVRLKKIEEQYAISVDNLDEAADVLQEIEKDTYLADGIINIPPASSSDFTQIPLEIFRTDDMLKGKLIDIFNANPDSLYVLSEEESISNKGLTRFNFADALEHVVPYIREWGQLTDYWITDGKNTTVTFHREGIVYWKNKANLNRAVANGTSK